MFSFFGIVLSGTDKRLIDIFVKKVFSMLRLIYFIGIFSLIFVSCKKDTIPQSEIDEALIQTYIADNNLDFTKHSSGLYYKITKVGAGASPTYYSSVKVTYTGTLLDGTIFDSRTLPYYPLSSLIYGWQIGVPLLRSGGSGTFIIPSGLGYGTTASGDIPANSVLIFDVALIDFK